MLVILGVAFLNNASLNRESQSNVRLLVCKVFPLSSVVQNVTVIPISAADWY